MKTANPIAHMMQGENMNTNISFFLNLQSIWKIQTTDTNTISRVIEKVKYKEFVNPCYCCTKISWFLCYCVEFRNVLFRQEIEVHTDHINNIDIATTSKLGFNRIQRWHWLIEEFNPTFLYLPGKHNINADALSRLETSDSEMLLEIDMFSKIK